MEWDRQFLSVTLKGARGRQVFLLLRPVGKWNLGKGVVVDREKVSSSACSGCSQVNKHRLHLSIPESLDSLAVGSLQLGRRWSGEMNRPLQDLQIHLQPKPYQASTWPLFTPLPHAPKWSKLSLQRLSPSRPQCWVTRTRVVWVKNQAR